jgi:very-short-patch-repair endonuclease
MPVDKKILLLAAKDLRKNSTDAENYLWKTLRSNRLQGIKFRRQHIIGQFIVDFVCLERKIIIELDGGHHASQKERDNERDSWLESEGYKVLRFWNNELFENTDGVMNNIMDACINSPSPQPLSPKGRGVKA